MYCHVFKNKLLSHIFIEKTNIRVATLIAMRKCTELEVLLLVKDFFFF